MFIQTETTPNPATLKFLPGRPVLPEGTAEFSSRDAAAGKSILAEELFKTEGVERVFFGTDFVSVTKEADADWKLLKTRVMAVLMQHFVSGLPVVEDMGATAQESDGSGEEDGEIVMQIKEILETRVRPAVAQDGGDVMFDSFRDGTVYLHMRGACAGCPSATITLKSGIENLLKHFIPEVESVEQVAAF